jgi:hypothetical protein
MIVEALILDGQDGLDELSRDARERNVDALLAEDGERLTILHVKERRRLRHRADAAQRLAIGNVAGDTRHEPDARAEHQHHHRRHRDGQTAMRAIQGR